VLRVVRAIASSSHGHHRGLQGDASDDTSDDRGDSTPDQAQQG
jgi:hypothetical protein